MAVRRLVYLGVRPERAATGELRHEGRPLSPGEALLLERRRSPWNANHPQERVIVGAHASRADVLLEGEGIHPEHLRLYFPRVEPGGMDLLVIQPASTRVDGRAVEPRDWAQLVGGEELELGPWRFRYEST